MRWLQDTPRAVVRAHLAMLPRLEAETSLLTAQRVAVGTRSLSKSGFHDLIRDWLRLSRGDQPPARPASRTSLQALGASVGIGYREVPTR